MRYFQIYPGERSKLFNTKYFKVTNYVGNSINASVICFPLSFEKLVLDVSESL